MVSCYEAGRDGFWLHRALQSQGINNCVVDSSSIEVQRRSRRAKSDRLDATKLLTMLLRYHGGETRVWSVVEVPSAAAEDQRQLHREMMTLKDERTEHVNRIKGLLAGYGLAVEVDKKFLERLAALRTWDGQEVPAELRQRLQREYARWQQVDEQIDSLEKVRVDRIRYSTEPEMSKVRQLLQVAGVGVNSVSLFVRERLAGVGSRTVGNWGRWRAWHRRRTRAAAATTSKGSARRATHGCVRCWWRLPGAGCVGNREVA